MHNAKFIPKFRSLNGNLDENRWLFPIIFVILAVSNHDIDLCGKSCLIFLLFCENTTKTYAHITCAHSLPWIHVPNLPSYCICETKPTNLEMTKSTQVPHFWPPLRLYAAKKQWQLNSNIGKCCLVEKDIFSPQERRKRVPG